MASRTATVIGRAIQRVADADSFTVSDRELLRRFAAEHDQAAFAALVERHTGLVLGACRRLLPTVQDAEDACQATFLVLARKAGGVRWGPSVANWLYDTARKVAGNARVAAQRRERRERRAAVAESIQPVDRMTGRELLLILDEELRKLPPRYREPLLLCYFEGLTRDEAAARLGVVAGTLKMRLVRGRKRLGYALTKRGVGLGVGLLSLAAISSAEASPPRLVQAILATASGSAPAAVAALAEGVFVNGVIKKSVLGALVFVALTVIGLGVGALALNASGHPADRPEPEKEKPQAENPKPADGGQVFTYSGKVLSPDGKPIAGAGVYVSGLRPGVIDFVPRTKTGDDGTFKFTLRRDEFGDKGYVPASRSPPEKFVFVGIVAEGYGSVASAISQPADREHFTYWMPPEEVVKGRVVDLTGKPMADVRVSAWLHYGRADKDRKPLPHDTEDKPGVWVLNVAPQGPGQMDVTTDKDGKFTLRGIARDWIYEVFISGPTIVNTKAQIIGRAQQPTTVPGTGVYDADRGAPKLLQFGSEFTHVAAPSKPVLGTVREKGTGKPIAGAKVEKVWTRDDEPSGRAETDKDGKYKLTGLAGGQYTLTFRPPAHSPYLDAEVTVDADQPGIEPVVKDIEIPRQAMATGRVTDQATGKPVRGWVEYRPLAANPNAKQYPLLSEPRWRQGPPTSSIAADGRFQVPALPGPGVLLVHAEGEFFRPRLAKEDRVEGVVVKNDPDLIDSLPRPASPAEFHGYKIIDVKEGKDIEVSLAVTSGRQRALKLEFPDGKPRKVTVVGLRPLPANHGDVIQVGEEVVVQGLQERERRRVTMSSYDGQFAAVFVVDGSETGPVAIKLQPTSTITGRLLDAAGKPIKGLSFQVLYDDGDDQGRIFLNQVGFRLPTPEEQKRDQATKGFGRDKLESVVSPEKTDEQGRFQLPSIIPGVGFDLKVMVLSEPDEKGRQFIKGMVKVGRGTARSAETLDLGDLKMPVAPKE